VKTTERRTCPVCNTLFDGNSDVCPVCALNSALQPDNHATATELRFEHYQILKNGDQSLMELGHGSMGVTYKALDVQLQRLVALKIINAKFIGDASARQRFVREARAAASVRHLNVATVHHLGEVGGDYFYAMEFVEGETLASVIQRSGRLSADLALEITAQVAAGLDAIYKQHLVHRDVKPSNIMVSLREGELKSVKIIDLGLAKAVAEEGSISASGTFVGTPGYASPEQFAGVGVDIRSDLYSMGIVLWEMLAGSLPFQGTSSELIYQHQHTSLPIESLDRVPKQAVPLLEILLEKDPAGRFQTPSELLKVLAIVNDAIESGHQLKQNELRSKAAGAVLQKGPAVLSTAQRNKRRRLLAWQALIPGVAALLIATFLFFNRGPRDTVVLAEKGVAVLPFDNLSPNKDDSYFADGVQDEILNNVAKVAQLKVISRTSVMQYRADTKRDLRQIASALGVANVLEGTVRRNGNHVRVSTELIDARNDHTIWADSYDRDLTDIFAIQSDVAQTIAGKLAATLSPTEKKSIEAKPTDNLEAYDLYLRANELFSETVNADAKSNERLLEAVGFLEQAVRLDQNFALAYCVSANVHGRLYFWYDATPERLALADAAISAALRLQPDLPEAHLAMARRLYHGYRNYDGARVELAVARRGLPNSVEATRLEAFIDRRQGNMEKAVQALNETLVRDPRNLGSLDNLAETLYAMRKFDAAAPLYDRIIDLWPNEPLYKVNRAIYTRFYKTGDTSTFWSAIAALPQSTTPDPDIVNWRVWFLLADHQWAEAAQLIEKMKSNHQASFTYGNRWVPMECYSVLLARLRNDQHASTPAFTEVREQLNQRVLKSPQDAELLSKLAVLDALLNNKEIAISEARRSAEMLPVAKDALVGPLILLNLAVVYVWTGELDLAFATLEPLSKMPFGIYYGQLKRDSYWEPIRQDPRYDKLLAELAPKN
jgi:serine/threonine protein kinase/cytochrome c-type biogenesis protein CcmH/NrfG